MITDLSEELDKLIMASAAKVESDRVKTDETKLWALKKRSINKIYEHNENNTS